VIPQGRRRDPGAAVGSGEEFPVETNASASEVPTAQPASASIFCLDHCDDHGLPPVVPPGSVGVIRSSSCSRSGMAAGSRDEANSTLTASAWASSKNTATRSPSRDVKLNRGSRSRSTSTRRDRSSTPAHDVFVRAAGCDRAAPQERKFCSSGVTCGAGGASACRHGGGLNLDRADSPRSGVVRCPRGRAAEVPLRQASREERKHHDNEPQFTWQALPAWAGR